MKIHFYLFVLLHCAFGVFGSDAESGIDDQEDITIFDSTIVPQNLRDYEGLGELPNLSPWMINHIFGSGRGAIVTQDTDEAGFVVYFAGRRSDNIPDFFRDWFETKKEALEKAKEIRRKRTRELNQLIEDGSINPYFAPDDDAGEMPGDDFGIADSSDSDSSWGS